MSQIERPWWLLVNKSAGLVTTVQEAHLPGEQTFIVRGEPVVQGLAWLTWGPAGALLGILLMTGAAIAFDISEQPWGLKFVFIAAFMGVPALLWGAVAGLTTRLARRYLDEAREAGRQSCTIRLNQPKAQLSFQADSSSVATTVAYGDIQQPEVTYPIGDRGGKRALLTLQTKQGPLTLLNETLGSQTQKTDLAEKIEAVLAAYHQKKSRD